MENILAGKLLSSISYKVNGVTRTLPYYLADGIYPAWDIFEKKIREGISRKEMTFARA